MNRPLYSDPTPAILAVSTLLSARNEVRARLDESHLLISKALWAVVDELKGEELAIAVMLLRIDQERYQRNFAALCSSCW